MTPLSIAARIQQQVGSWPDVRVDIYGGGMIFFHVGRREIGHLHGDRLADLPVPVRIREQLVAAGKASVHYIHPRTGWISYYIKGEQDIEPVVELFRLNYERPWLQQEQESSQTTS
jgi:Luciferase